MKNFLVEIGRARFSNTGDILVHLVNNEIANNFLNDLINYPHAYVLACLMDRQIKAERAWIIPFEIKERLGSFKFQDLIEVSKADYIKIFNDLKLHRFNNTMAIVFFEALELIN